MITINDILLQRRRKFRLIMLSSTDAVLPYLSDSRQFSRPIYCQLSLIYQ